MKKILFLAFLLGICIYPISSYASIVGGGAIEITGISAGPKTQTSIQVSWQTNYSGGEGYVEYGPTIEYGMQSVKAQSSSLSNWFVIIDSLNFSDTYHYRIVHTYNGQTGTSNDLI